MERHFNIPGQPKLYKINSRDQILTPKEKKSLRWRIAKKFPRKLLPMHACLLVKKGSGILISGASGVGKSTLSTYLIKQGYQSLANDFVAIWEQGDQLFAGALDLVELNNSRFPVKVDNCYFLNPKDSRDIFKCSKDEAISFYCNSMKPWTKSVALQFAETPIFNKLYEQHISFGNRSNIGRWERLIQKTSSASHVRSVGIIGLGVIGQDIANLLIAMPKLTTLNLYSPNKQSVSSLALDLRSTGSKTKVVASSTIKKCLESSDLVIFSFRSSEASKVAGLQERYGRIHEHAKIVWEITRSIRATRYNGVILVVSNPVDLLSLFTYHFANMSSLGIYDWEGLFSNQIYGVGLGLDYARLHVVSHKKLEIAGEHGDLQWLAQPNRSTLMSQKNVGNILDKVKFYSETIRKWVSRTRFGPSHEVYNIVESFISQKNNQLLRLSTASSHNGFWGQPINLEINRLLPISRYTLDSDLSKHIRNLENDQKKLLVQLTNKLKNNS
jgi:malate/lactate dehydrogenase